MTDAPDTGRLERILGVVLRIGAVTSTSLLAVGLVLSLSSPSVPLGPLLMSAGLLILMATPVARVVASVIGYAAERDWTFLVLTATVLVILLSSLLVALNG
jgi:uncharacterized membrane protein